MDHTQTSTDRAEGPDGTALAFAAFVLAHGDCGGAMEESRLDGFTLAGRCPRCDETRVFRTARTARRSTRT